MYLGRQRTDRQGRKAKAPSQSVGINIPSQMMRLNLTR